MKADLHLLYPFISGTHACAIEMMKNAAYVKKELPTLRMPDSLRERIDSVCNDLIGTKHDLISEVVELEETLVADPESLRISRRVQLIQAWIRESVGSLDECVSETRSGVDAGEADGSLLILLMESTVNIINTTPARIEPPDSEEEKSGEDYDDDEPIENADCYAFQIEDSYPIGELTRSVRSLMDRTDLSPDVRDGLKVFLFAMVRLPMITPGVRMSLALRIDQGGESDWIEIRMEEGEFTLGRGSWVDGGAGTATAFEVSEGYRDGDEFAALGFAEPFKECADDTCREVIIEDTAEEPFTGWDLTVDKSRWSSL